MSCHHRGASIFWSAVASSLTRRKLPAGISFAGRAVGNGTSDLPLTQGVISLRSGGWSLSADSSLIPGLGVKLSANILAGPTVLSAVGASPPHDGVRRRWWINVASAVSLFESSQTIGRSHQRHRPGRDVQMHDAWSLIQYRRRHFSIA
jgi:hypothetical protein